MNRISDGSRSMISPRAAFLLLALGSIFSWTPAARADESAPLGGLAQFPAANSDSSQDILFCTPRRPLLIRLQMFVNGEGFRSLRRKWADAQFAELDADKNGFLEGEEIKRLPAVAPGMANSGAAQTVTPDSEPADGKVSLEECRRYLLAGTGTPFSIQSLDNPQGRIVFNPGMQNVQVNLFPKLDTDQDGKLSKREIEAAAANLRRYDRNEDDIVDNNELSQALPEEQASSRQQLAGVLALLYVVDPSDAASTIARRLLEAYDKASRDPASKLFRKDEKLSQSELQMEPDVFARADKNSDGKLDRSELKGLSAVMTPSVELMIEAPSSRGTFSVQSLRPLDPALAPLLSVHSKRDGEWILKLDETELVLRASGPAPGADSQLRDLYLQRFAQMDGDKNDYLELTEMERYGFQPPFFTQADVDGDKKLFEKEYVAHVEREIGLSQSSLTWEVSSDGRSLFGLIDTSPADGRLSLRELSDAPRRFAQWDANGDDIISLSELAIQLDGVFKAGAPRVNGPFITPQSVNVQAAGAKTIGQIINNFVGGKPAEWFTKMDRNSDGDLSPREFLGRRVLFDKIDKNGDGLISASEANAASRAALQEKP